MNHLQVNSNLSRNRNIDVLRGIAVILMLNQHIGVWMVDQLFNHKFILALNALGGISAPLFVTLAGLGTVFLEKRHDRTDRIFLKRGAGILLYGYMLNFLTPSWFSMGSWYVLHMIGAGILLTPLLRRLPTPFLLILMPLVLSATILIQYILGTPVDISNSRMGDLNMPGGVFRLILAEGHFPIFPWLSFFIAGIISGRWYVSQKKINILSAGTILLSMCILFSAMPYITPNIIKSVLYYRFFKFLPSFYPALTPISLMLISFSMLIIYIFILLEKKLFHKKLDVIESLGRISLTVLVTHVVIFRECAIRLNVHRKMETMGTFLMIVAVISLFSVLASLWKKKQYKFSLEWLLRRF